LIHGQKVPSAGRAVCLARGIHYSPVELWPSAGSLLLGAINLVDVDPGTAAQEFCAVCAQHPLPWRALTPLLPLLQLTNCMLWVNVYFRPVLNSVDEPNPNQQHLQLGLCTQACNCGHSYTDPIRSDGCKGSRISENVR